ncbi:endospore germination permease [Paenibacillus chartarius]|uniref:Endospore germination permease n=1 Tax=Paenibacillus chartarius TaxID=747481 RepID=A0ABV6DL09_9BACL
MHGKQYINIRQFSWLTSTLLTGGGLVSVQNVLARASGPDMWLSYWMPTLYVFIIVALLGYLNKVFPGRHIYRINTELFGKWFGGLLNAVILYHFWMILVRDISLFNRFFVTTLLPRTPLEIFGLLFMIVMIYYGRTSLEVVARVNDVFFPLFVLIVLLMPFSLLNEIQPSLIQPIMASSFRLHISSNIISSSWYADILIMGAFLHMVHSSTELKSSLRRGAILSSFILSLVLALNVFVFGPYLPGNFIYPTYELVQQIHITDFLDRVDLIILMIWFPVTVCKVVMIYIALLYGVTSFFRKADHSSVNKPLAAFLVITALAVFRSTTEVFSYGNYASAAIVFGYQPVYFVLLFIAVKVYLRRNGLNPADLSQRREPPVGRSNSGRRGNMKIWDRISTKMSYSSWRLTSNAVLCVIVVVVAAGYWTGQRWAAGGLIAGAMYTLCMVILLLSTYAETKSTSS